MLPQVGGNLMKLSDDDQTSFPQLTEYLRNAFPRLTSNGVIVFNLRKFGNLSDAQARHALMWGTDPLVSIVDLDAGQCGVPQAFGCTSDSTEIQIDDDLVAEFEKGGSSNLRLAPNGHHVYLTGVTLLHEMCHWGNFLNGAAEATDAGNQFETAVYGGVVG
jgi:zincin-like metallopeptidase toxin 3 of polymorphic toxin system